MYRRNSSAQPRSEWHAQQQQPYNPGNTAPQFAPQQPPQYPANVPQHQSVGPTLPQGPANYTQPQVPAAATNPQQQYVQQPTPRNDPAPPQQPNTNDPDSFINSKITKVNAKNKVLDFSDALVKAHREDYANIHGCGGKGHAPNSGVCLTLCDYSKGTGNASITVRYNIDVRDIDRLLCVVQAATGGLLGLTEQMRGVREFATANGAVIGWLQSNHQPSLQDLQWLQQTLGAGLMAQDPDNKNDRVLWHWEVQKNNPYKGACKMINGVEHTPVSTVSFAYNPAKNYAWTIKVANYMAPITRQANGASSHNNKAAIEKREVFFPVTTEDLLCALSDVSHYIHLWEYRMFRTVDAMCTEKERRAEAKRQQTAR